MRNPSQEFIFPQPDAEGINEMKEFYLRSFNRTLSTAEAHEVVSRLIRYLYLINHQCFITPSTAENLTTTDRLPRSR